jgi:hypothetical protein
MNAQQIQAFLRTALNDNNICVAEPRESKKKEYIFAILKSEKDLTGYTESNYENEYIVIWENDPGRYGYGFSHEVFYPGVHMRSDGTGEPDIRIRGIRWAIRFYFRNSKRYCRIFVRKKYGHGVRELFGVEMPCRLKIVFTKLCNFKNFTFFCAIN